MRQGAEGGAPHPGWSPLSSGDASKHPLPAPALFPGESLSFLPPISEPGAGTAALWSQAAFQIFPKSSQSLWADVPVTVSSYRSCWFQEPGSANEEQGQGAEREPEEGAGVTPSSPEEWPESPTEEGHGLSPGEGEPRALGCLPQGLPRRVGGVQGVCMGSPTPLPAAPFLQMGWAQTRQRPRRPVHQPGNVQPQGPGSSSPHHPLPSNSALPST